LRFKKLAFHWRGRLVATLLVAWGVRSDRVANAVFWVALQAPKVEFLVAVEIF
jgi:hypothetical protein